MTTPEDTTTALVRRLFRAVDAADVDDVLSCFERDATYLRPGFPALVGREDLGRFYRTERPIASSDHHIEQVVAAGGAAAAWGVMTGRMRDGDPVRVSFCDAFRISTAGRILLRQTFFAVPAV